MNIEIRCPFCNKRLFDITKETSGSIICLCKCKCLILVEINLLDGIVYIIK